MDTFRTLLDESQISLYGFSSVDEWVFSARCLVTWRLNLELREWGVKSMTLSVDKIGLEYTLRDDATDEDIDHEFTIEDFDGWTVNHEQTMSEPINKIQPESIYIDRNEKSIEITWER